MRGSKAKKVRREASKLALAGLGAPIKPQKKRQRLVDVPNSGGLMVDVSVDQVRTGTARVTYQQLKKKGATDL